ncbi:MULTISPECIES: DUF4291 domain-containing protein [Spirulina sp. CCY15215]|uniref:DUF4291 domain-containing protein n=1 Tax=Spirulina sp. CCY15215 TaxID=2767591 RepID=UPI0019508C48|nr:DUF4291 domain-containing protein [Spirulina major]
MVFVLESYRDRCDRLPKTGRHILAQYDEESIVVYQAYHPAIGHFAAEQGYFGGESFKFDRMSWIKTSFLWMMYRSGWGTKPGQEVILAIKLKRTAFDEILSLAIPSHFSPKLYATQKEWKQALKRSLVRLQWDPDRQPNGDRLERRAIQLGLRGEVLSRYAREWIVEIEDISDFVREQYNHIRDDRENLLIPREENY